MGEYIIPAAAAIVIAIIEAIAGKERHKAAKEREANAIARERRQKESRLSMKMSNACMQLSIVTANALTNGHNNGNVERARKAAEEAQREYDEFLQELASEKVWG